MGRIGKLPLIGRLLVVLFPGHGRPQRDDVVGVCVHQQEVLVRLGLLFAAVLLLVLHGIGGTLTTALGAVKGHIGGALQRQGAGGNPARVALRRQTESGEGPLQDGQHVMHPVVGLGLAQLAWSAMHGLSRIGVLEDEETQPFVFHRWQGPGGPTTGTTLARRALQGLVWRIPQRIGGGKRRKQMRKCCVRQSGRSEKLSWSVL